MFDVITFGSATWDIFIRDKKISFKKDQRIFNQKGVFLPLGSKIDLDEIHFSSGGGATNTAACFSSLGLKTACCSLVGSDLSGRQIIDDLKKFKVETKLILENKRKPTNHSIIISLPERDRTILAYRGASEDLSVIPWSQIKAKWLYLAPFSGQAENCLEKIVEFAFKNGIKVAVNPSKNQLKKIKKILNKIDVLILNQEEASLLTNIPYHKEKLIFEKASSLCSGILVMTKGKRGAMVSLGKERYQVGIIKEKVVDRTGAGDSFGSAFVSALIMNKSIEESLQLASANATSCLQFWGAKNGLLKKNQKYDKIKVNKYA